MVVLGTRRGVVGGTTPTWTNHDPEIECWVPTVGLISDPDPTATGGVPWVGAVDRVAIANSADLVEFDERVVAVAGRWADATKVLFGLVSLIGAVGGALSVEALSTGSRVLVGVGVLVSMGLALTAVVLLQSASGGSLKTHKPAVSMLNLAEQRHARAETALGQVRVGRMLAIGAVVAVSVTVAAMWLLTPEDSKSRLVVETTTGETYCAIHLWRTGDTVEITTNTKRTATIDPSLVDSIEPAEECS